MRVSSLRSLLLLIAGLFGCNGPFGLMAGGLLEGKTAPAPSDWAAVGAYGTGQLETRPEDPYSVTTWNVVLDGVLHVPADFLNPVKRWPHYVEADDRVRIRMGALVYACRAVRLEDATRIQALREAAAAKYDLDPDGTAASAEVWWYRIDRR